ncbi:MAG TPA: hypothetical protein VKU39_22970 [Streptosporangiaceae bacterium]|nr:hypothetical protein [Streptosporangiaceae bacterium]
MWIRFLSGPDVDALALPNQEIITAVRDAFRAHGESRVVVEPRTHLIPPNDGAGHFNVLRGLLDVMDKVVVDDWRESRSGRFGALRAHVDTGRLTEQSLYAELGEIVAGRKPGRERDDERILFWHRGLAIFDIALGLALLRAAEERHVGTMLRYR